MFTLENISSMVDKISVCSFKSTPQSPSSPFPQWNTCVSCWILGSLLYLHSLFLKANTTLVLIHWGWHWRWCFLIWKILMKPIATGWSPISCENMCFCSQVRVGWGFNPPQQVTARLLIHLPGMICMTISILNPVLFEKAHLVHCFAINLGAVMETN